MQVIQNVFLTERSISWLPYFILASDLFYYACLIFVRYRKAATRVINLTLLAQFQSSFDAKLFLYSNR